MFVNGLLASVHPIVERFRPEQPHYKLNFNLTVAFSRDEADSKCAPQSKTIVRSVFPRNAPSVVRAHTSREILAKFTSRTPSKLMVFFMEPTTG